MKLNIKKLNTDLHCSFADVKDLLTFRTQVGDDVLESDFLMPSEHINIIPVSDRDDTNQPELAKYFDHDDEILISLKFHPTFHPQEIDIDTIKFNVTHAQAVIKEGDNIITLNNPQSYMGGLLGDDITYPTIFLKPKGISRQHLRNIKNWLLVVNSLTTFPSDYNGGDDINIKTLDDVEWYSRMLLGTLGGEPFAVAEIEDYPVYCAELIYLAFNLGMVIPFDAEESLNHVNIFDQNRNPFIELCSFKEINFNSFEPRASLALTPLSSDDMVNNFGSNVGIDDEVLAELCEDEGLDIMLGRNMRFFPPHAFLIASAVTFEYVGHGFNKNYVIG